MSSNCIKGFCFYWKKKIKNYFGASYSDDDNDSTYEAILDLISSDEETSTAEDYSTLNSDFEIQNHNMEADISSTQKISPLGRALANWRIIYKISLLALNALLIILRSYGHETDLPKDSRTLLGTPKNSHSYVEVMNNGKYIYFGILYGIEIFMKKVI